MSDAGYSGTPLGRKLGLKDGQRALLLGVPAGLDAISGFSGFRASETEIGTVAARDIDYAHVFETERSVLEELAPKLAARLKPDGMLWIAYQKGAARVNTDLSRDVGWDPLTDAGWRGVSLIAVDEVWSAMRFRPRE